MSTAVVDIGDDVAALLDHEDEPLDQAARRMIVVELYRRAAISAGRAAELLSMSLLDFIVYSGKLGIPFFRMTQEDWEKEKRAWEAL